MVLNRSGIIIRSQLFGSFVDVCHVLLKQSLLLQLSDFLSKVLLPQISDVGQELLLSCFFICIFLKDDLDYKKGETSELTVLEIKPAHLFLKVAVV